MSDYYLERISEALDDLAAANGLPSRRERIATQVLAGLVGDDSDALVVEENVDLAARYADALLKRLED